MNTARPITSALALVLALGLVVAGTPALAQTAGRVTVVLKDIDGNPIANAKVTVTTKELTKFHAEGKSNKRGQVIIGLSDATKMYDFHIEAEGYPPIDVPIQPQIGNIIREVTLLKSGSASAAADPDAVASGVRYTPTEQAFNGGVEALRAGDYPTAETRMKEALAITPDYAPALSTLAGIYVQGGKFAEALETGQKYAALVPDDPQGQRILYEAHQGLGHTAEAEAALTRLATLDKSGDTAAIFYNEAVAALKANNVARAEGLLAKSLEIQPDLVPALSALAVAQLLGKKHAEAAATTERLIAIDPKDAKALRMRWEAYKALDDKAKADEAFQALAGVDPAGVAKTFYDAGVQHFQQGEMAEARESFEQTLTLNPDHPRAHYHLGMIYVNLEQPAKAKTHLQRFVALAPEDPEAPVARDMLGYLK